MDNVIDLAERRSRREARAMAAGERRRPTVTTFFFDLACPFTYLAAERVDRFFPDVRWVPTSGSVVCGDRYFPDAETTELAGEIAKLRATELRLPLELPDRFGEPVPAAMRVAALAASVSHTRASAFALAAGRLAFCGGYDLADPEVLMEAAAAAGLPLDAALAAAGDPTLDGPIVAAGHTLRDAGADRLPALRVDGAIVWGEDRVTRVMDVIRARTSRPPVRVPDSHVTR